MVDVSKLFELAKGARAALGTAASSVAEFNEALAKSASTLTVTDLTKLRAELEEVHAESKTMSAELEAAITARIGG